MAFSVPKPNTVLDLEMGDGAKIKVRLHGNKKGSRIFIANGNGFAIDGYLPFWGPLCDRFEIAAFDFRNHGQNPVATSGLPGHSYAQMTFAIIQSSRAAVAGHKR